MFLEKGLSGMRFNELVRLLEQSGFRLIKEKGSIRYYGKPGVDRLIRVIIMEPKKFPPGPAMLFSRPPV
jgi:predicted RNA binding protein YcfA (HicA-like mRNA interferase family)